MIVFATATLAIVSVALALWGLRSQLLARAACARAADAVERHFNVLEAVGDGIYIVDEALRITHINEEAERLLRAPAGALVGRRLDEIVDPLGSELVPDVRLARRSGALVERTAAFVATQSWVEVRIKPAASETLVSLRDVSERSRGEVRLRENEQRLRLVTQNVDAVLWTTDRESRFTGVAGGALADLELRAEHLIDQPCAALLAAHLLIDVYAGNPLRAESARGERWLRHHVEPLRDADGAVIGAVGVSLDITELKCAQQQLFENAHRDRLTRLPNRLSLEQRLNETIEEASRDARSFALLFIDLDRFKTINDTLGHGVGDDVLREVAGRLQESVRGGDVIARPGGDEFIILLSRVSGAAEVTAIGGRLVRALASPVSAGGRELFVSASIGAAIFPQHGTDGEALVAHADAAMYRAKALGGSGAAIFDPAMEVAAAERLALENELRHALAREELRLLYQPVIDLRTRRVVGCEALVRWEHRTRGTIHPNAFIPIAEETGAIVALDGWVLRAACASAARLRKIAPGFFIAINLSPRDLREPDLPRTIAAALDEHRLGADALVVELTAHDALDDGALPVLRALCALGVQVCVDDFGSGYGSLAYLKRLPITALKIGRAFIREVADDPYDQAIVGAIVSLGKALGLHLTAEGLETDAQVDFVARLGCDAGQGYRFAMPLQIEVLERLITPPLDEAPLQVLGRPA
jgi:diguanylate cyclase (GGDEF)-like protein/PAS domain S-box-containing protein